MEDRTTTIPPTYEREKREQREQGMPKTPYISPPEFKKAHMFKCPTEFEAIDNHVFEVKLSMRFSAYGTCA